MDNPLTVIGFLKDAGVIGALVIGVIMFVRGDIVPRWMYDQQVQEKEYFRGLVDRLTAVADRTVATAERVMTPTNRGGRERS